MAKCINVSVSLYEGESTEHLIKRFLRECKKEEIEKECRKRSEYKTKLQRKREKRERSYARRISEERKREKGLKKEMKNRI